MILIARFVFKAPSICFRHFTPSWLIRRERWNTFVNCFKTVVERWCSGDNSRAIRRCWWNDNYGLDFQPRKTTITDIREWREQRWMFFSWLRSSFLRESIKILVKIDTPSQAMTPASQRTVVMKDMENWWRSLHVHMYLTILGETMVRLQGWVTEVVKEPETSVEVLNTMKTGRIDTITRVNRCPKCRKIVARRRMLTTGRKRVYTTFQLK